MTEVTSSSPPDCPGCSRVVRLSEAEVARLLDAYFAGNAFATVGDAAYADRLRVCGGCPDLRYGTTCRHCGCLVAVRAKLQGKSCPAPVAKW